MLQQHGFKWDNSMPTQLSDPPLWPFTLDYQAEHGCVIEPCPHASYPGLWEIPMVDYIDKTGEFCNNVDSCEFPANKKEALDLLRYNFARHYLTNKAPFPVYLRARWFEEAHYNIEALEEFLDELLLMKDVFFVTISQAVDWMKQPTKLADIQDFAPWRCDRDEPSTCRQINTCVYLNVTLPPNSFDHPGERFVSTCAESCPPLYPFVGNPQGRLD
ncbi:PREDICTED: uncharacterized protein LOC106820435 [Priapulus caudatus]|uniref:Uncharacterized protein LOC106820435 n=1 Tax=Priapulus caudatus TaxID=37621 RepID=A0ABM1F7L7_PRICU|nr:PREDICTED: uncharacterized protein LOC106820435 [Priapulus caudatus]